MSDSHSQDSLAAIVVAGGSGSRFHTACGADGQTVMNDQAVINDAPVDKTQPKQFAELYKYPLYIWSISKIYKSGSFKHIVITMPVDYVEKAKATIGQIFPDSTTYIDVIAGGATRQESVYFALKHLAAKEQPSRYVIMHDAARPFLTDKMIADTIATVTTRGACSIGTPVSDTLKKVAAPNLNEPGEDLTQGLIIETVDRTNLYAVQTPQAAPLDTLLACHELARERNIGVTDDAAILEYFGHTVVIFPGQNNNIKITVAEDLRAGELLAPLFLAARPH